MTVHVYWGSGSAFAWRVLLALEIKGVAYESHLLQFSKGETKTPEFLKISPRGRVPAIVDGDVTMTESIAIMAYLDAQYPEKPLFGKTPKEKATIWQGVSEGFSDLEPPIQDLAAAVFFGKPEENLEHLKARAAKVHDVLARMEATLGKQTWLAGESVSAADVVAFPHVMMLLRVASKDAAAPLQLDLSSLDKRYPKLAAWQKRIEALPGYDKTYPPHWRG